MSNEAARFAALVERTRRLIQEQAGDPWIALLQSSRWISAGEVWRLTEPVEGYRQDPASGLYSGPPGLDSPPANTHVEFAGRVWAMAQSPLPETDVVALRLLVHEAWHAAGQPVAFAGMALDERDGDDLLDRAAGRTWLRLELAALSAAVLAGSPAERRRHAACALAFHSRIEAEATVAEMRRQHALELLEGMAEFVSWKCIDPEPARIAAHIATLPEAGTVVRGFAYRSGVGWGFLLDEFRPSWREELRDEPNLPALLARSIEPADTEDYDRDRIARKESLRAAQNQRRVAGLRRRFCEGPVLRLPLAAGRFTFDPHGMTPVSGGTVYTPLTWTTPDGGHLLAEGGAFLASDWSELRVPLEGLDPAAGTPLRGSGWALALPENWRIERDGPGWRAGPIA